MFVSLSIYISQKLKYMDILLVILGVICLLMGLYSGLFILNKETSEIKSTAITKEVTTIYRIRDGAYWVGTRNYGLYYYDMENDSIRQYTVDDHLSSNYIYGIAPDAEGHLWIEIGRAHV